jgi:hypothetical protein
MHVSSQLKMCDGGIPANSVSKLAKYWRIMAGDTAARDLLQ